MNEWSPFDYLRLLVVIGQQLGDKCLNNLMGFMSVLDLAFDIICCLLGQV